MSDRDSFKATFLSGGKTRFTAAERHQQSKAEEFYAGKLENNPTMARYQHYLGALAAAKGDDAAATNYYRTSISNSNNVMTRNDLALHLARTKNLRDPNNFKSSLTEFKKAFVVAGYEQPTLQKNIAALYAAHGDFKEASEHARKALDLDPSDGTNHRNMSKMLDVMGDQISALKHNKEAIALDAKQGKPPNPRSYRAASVQTFLKDGNLKESIDLIRQARIIERKKYECPTSVRTGEIIAKIMKRVGDPLEELARAEKELQEKKAIEESIINGGIAKSMPKLNRVGKFTRENG